MDLLYPDLFNLLVSLVPRLHVRRINQHWKHVWDRAHAKKFIIKTDNLEWKYVKTPFDIVWTPGAYNNTLEERDYAQHVHTLDLSRRDVSNVSALGNLHTLHLAGCKKVSYVSALGNLHTLDLTSCQGVSDVSALGNLHTLYLNYCTGIRDVSALGNVHYLSLTGCRGVSNVSGLGNVHTLYLHGCSKVSDVSALGGVYNETSKLKRSGYKRSIEERISIVKINMCRTQEKSRI